MLGVIPVRRTNSLGVVASSLYNIVITAPWVAAFWVLTEWYPSSNSTCGGIPWDVANFARWAFLGIAAYQIFAIPFNIYTVIRREHLNREVRIHHWLTTFDSLHWLFNWGLWFYLIAGLVNRNQCNYTPLTQLLWCVVFISGGFGMVGLAALTIAGFSSLVGLIKDIEHESKAQENIIDSLAAQGRVRDHLKHEGGAVEILEIRRNQPSTIMQVRERADAVYERNGQEIQGQGERIIDKQYKDDLYDRESRIIREKKAESQRRERDEVINIRDDRREDYGQGRIADSQNRRARSPEKDVRDKY